MMTLSGLKILKLPASFPLTTACVTKIKCSIDRKILLSIYLYETMCKAHGALRGKASGGIPTLNCRENENKWGDSRCCSRSCATSRAKSEYLSPDLVLPLNPALSPERAQLDERRRAEVVPAVASATTAEW